MINNIRRVSRNAVIAVTVWLALNIVLLRILADHQDYSPVVLGFSAPYAALLGLILVAALGGVIFVMSRNAIRLPRLILTVRSNSIFRLVVIIAATGVLLAIWLLPFQGIDLSSVQREAIRSWETITVLAVVYVGLFWRAKEIVMPWSASVIVAAAISCGVVVLAIHFLDRFPQLNTIDELHNWSVQWTFANTGLLGDTLYKQMIPLPQPIYDSPHYIAGFLLRLFGDAFWQARFTRMLLTCLALPFIYLAGVRMYGKRAGLFAVVFALLLIVPVAYVRPDFFVGIMLSIAIYVYLRAQTTRRPWIHYLAGLCVALGGEGHPLAYRFGLVFAFLYGVRWLYEMWKTRRIFIDGRLVALGLGGLTGMLIYLSIHILPGLDQGLRFAKNYSPIGRTLQDQINNAGYLIIEQFNVWMSSSPFELIFVVLGAGVALIKFEDGDRLLLALLFISEGLMLATYGYYRPFYQVHFLPIFALLSGRVLANLTSSTKNSRSGSIPFSRLALASMVLIVAFLTLYQDAVSAAPDPTREEFTSIGDQLKADLPKDKIVVGNEDYFLEIRSPNYYGIETVTTDNWFKVNYQGYALWQVTKPDFFILSGDVIDEAKYIDYASIWQYMNDNHFTEVRCYTHTGLIKASLYARDITGWQLDPQCKDYSLSAHAPQIQLPPQNLVSIPNQ